MACRDDVSEATTEATATELPSLVSAGDRGEDTGRWDSSVAFPTVAGLQKLGQEPDAGALGSFDCRGQSRGTGNLPPELVLRVALCLDRLEVFRLLSLCSTWAAPVRQASAMPEGIESTDELWICLGLQEQLDETFRAMVARRCGEGDSDATGVNYRLLLACLQVGDADEPLLSWVRDALWEKEASRRVAASSWETAWRRLSHGEFLQALCERSDCASGPSIGPHSLLGLALVLHRLDGATTVVAETRGRVGVPGVVGIPYICEQWDCRLLYTSDPVSVRGCRAEVARLTEFSLFESSDPIHAIPGFARSGDDVDDVEVQEWSYQTQCTSM